MLIRPATPADFPLMRTLELQSDGAAHWSEREYDALVAAQALKRIALVAVEEGAPGIGGFVIARCGPYEWEIENVVVAGEHRRRGVGTGLVQEILHAAGEAGVGSVLLEVRQSNTAARQLYEKLGFRKSGERAGYYREPTEDALLFRFPVANL